MNAYRTMMLRGIFGCFIYAVDDDLRDYLKQCNMYVKSAISKVGVVTAPIVSKGDSDEEVPSRPGHVPAIISDPDPDKRFGKMVVCLRKERGLSQEELAFCAGISRSYMGVIERGEKSPSIDTIAKVAKGLKVSIGDLFTFDERDS